MRKQDDILSTRLDFLPQEAVLQLQLAFGHITADQVIEQAESGNITWQQVDQIFDLPVDQADQQEA